MDALVVVGSGRAPTRVTAMARHWVHVIAAPVAPDVVADLRERIPRDVGVHGPDDAASAATAAEQLHQAGLPVTLYTNDPVELAVRRTEETGAVVVLDAGHPVGILTLLGFLVGQSRSVR